MKSLVRLGAVLCLSLNLMACAQGPGSHYRGSLEVVAQLSEAHEDSHFHEGDEEEAHWEIEHTHLHVAGLQLHKSGSDFTQTWEEPAGIELSGSPVELFHFDAVAGVEYDEVYLVLAEGSEEEHAHEETEEESEEEEAHGPSTFSLEARLESEIPCRLHLELHEPGLKIALSTSEPFSIERDQDHGLNIEVDLHHLLEALPLKTLCAEQSEIHISEEENADLYEEAREHFLEIFSAEFSGSPEPAEDSGHDHGHSH